MNLIIFIGARSQFPDCLLRLVETEIEGSSAVRLASADDLSKAVAGGVQPRLVVLEESLWAQAGPIGLPDFSAKNMPSLAIAFQRAQRVLQSIDPAVVLANRVSFLPMDLNVETWLSIIRLLLTGCTFVPSELQLSQPADAPADNRNNPPKVLADSALQKLTPRERDVLALVAEGMQNKHIAGRLQLSEHTVKLHLHHVISKLGARNRTEAALRFRRDGAA